MFFLFVFVYSAGATHIFIVAIFQLSTVIEAHSCVRRFFARTMPTVKQLLAEVKKKLAARKKAKDRKAIARSQLRLAKVVFKKVDRDLQEAIIAYEEAGGSEDFGSSEDSEELHDDDISS